MRKLCLIVLLYASTLLLLTLKLKASDSIHLTLNSALLRLDSSNLSLQEVNAALLQTKAAKRERQSALLPTIEANATYNHYLKKPVIFLPKGSPFGNFLELGSDNSYQASINATLPLLAIPLYRNLALCNMDILLAQETKRNTRLKLRADLRITFANCLLTHLARRVVEQNLATAEATLSNIINLTTRGLSSQYDLLRAQVQVSNIKPLVIQAKQNETVALASLRTLIGLPDSVHILLDNSLEELIASTTPHPTNKHPFTENPDLKLIKLQEKKLEIQKSLIRAMYFPQLAAFGNYQWQAQANDFQFHKYNWVATALIGVQIKIPIFSGLAKLHQEQQIKIGIQRTTLTYSNTEQQLLILQQSLDGQQEALQESILSSRQAMELAEKAINIARTRYNTGTGTLLELTDATAAHMQAALNYYKNLFNLYKISVEKDKLTGQE